MLTGVVVTLSLTLAHKVLEVVPLDVVREVADVDTTVLLRMLAHAVHHLFFGDHALFKAPRGSCSSTSFTIGGVRVVVVVVVVVIAVGCVTGSGGGSVDGGARPAVRASVIVTGA
jgi:hypothetical protein